MRRLEHPDVLRPEEHQRGWLQVHGGALPNDVSGNIRSVRALSPPPRLPPTPHHCDHHMLNVCLLQAGVLLLLAGIVQLIMGSIVILQITAVLNEVRACMSMQRSNLQ